MPVFKSSRKVQAFGSSLALTIPAMFVKINEVEKGSVVNVLYDLNGVLVASQLENLEALIERLMSMIDKLEERSENRKVKKGKRINSLNRRRRIADSKK
jgi:antitoxin component of MazEF toxin-antitoxin module